MKRAFFGLLALSSLACPKSGSEEHRSTEFATPKERVTFLCDSASCPSVPLDAAFHVYKTGEGTVVHAIVKVDVNDVHRWSMGCDDFTVEVRPKWVATVIAPTNWTLKTTPDTWRCAGERRVIHVKEGLVIRALLLRE